MFKLFRMDAARWVTPQGVADPSQVTAGRALKLLWSWTPLRAMAWFRLGTWLKRNHIPLAGIIQRIITLFYGLEIRVDRDYGGGLYIAHPVGTVIAAEKIGDNCTIINSVTIGLRSNTWAFPRIGNNVFIGAGARILGDIEIGDGAIIGANAVVIHDVPAGATVVGIPARVIKINGQRVDTALSTQQPTESIEAIHL